MLLVQKKKKENMKKMQIADLSFYISAHYNLCNCGIKSVQFVQRNRDQEKHTSTTHD